MAKAGKGTNGLPIKTDAGNMGKCNCCDTGLSCCGTDEGPSPTSIKVTLSGIDCDNECDSLNGVYIIALTSSEEDEFGNFLCTYIDLTDDYEIGVTISLNGTIAVNVSRSIPGYVYFCFSNFDGGAESCASFPHVMNNAGFPTCASTSATATTDFV